MSSVEQDQAPPIINCTGKKNRTAVIGSLTKKELIEVRKFPSDAGINNLFTFNKNHRCPVIGNREIIVSYFHTESKIKGARTQKGLVGGYCMRDDCGSQLLFETVNY